MIVTAAAAAETALAPRRGGRKAAFVVLAGPCIRLSTRAAHHDSLYNARSFQGVTAVTSLASPGPTAAVTEITA